MDKRISKKMMDRIAELVKEEFPDYAIAKTFYQYMPQGSTTFRVELAPKTDDGVVMGMEAQSFVALCGYDGIDPAALGKEITIQRIGRAKIVGYRTRARTKPYLVKVIDTGKDYIFSADALKRAAPEIVKEDTVPTARVVGEGESLLR